MTDTSNSLCQYRVRQEVRLNNSNLEAKPTETDNIKTDEVSTGQSRRAATDSEAKHWQACGNGKLSEQITRAQPQKSGLVPWPQ